MALRHNSGEVHERYAGTDEALIPSIDEYEKRAIQRGLEPEKGTGMKSEKFSNN